MDWESLTAEIDIYCERVDASYWAEPINAISNAAFLIAAVICWRMLRGAEDFGAKLLTANLALIGIGSYLFHTHANQWSL
ncbi:MAG: ceramidase domain-containing protein, partial [Pseudomonadota bacterium]